MWATLPKIALERVTNFRMDAIRTQTGKYVYPRDVCVHGIFTLCLPHVFLFMAAL